MTFQVILIFKEGDEFNVCLLQFTSYPYLRVPQVGDIVPLVAKVTVLAKTKNNPVESVEITYLDGVYEVLRVWPGRGQLLHPTPGFGIYTISDQLEGYGIEVRKRDLPEYADIPKSQAVLIDGTWAPVSIQAE
jgi:hypothetical protein